MLYHNVLLGQLKLIIFAGSVVSPDNYYIWKVIIKFFGFFYIRSITGPCKQCQTPVNAENPQLTID